MTEKIFWIGEDIDKENKNKKILRDNYNFDFDDSLDINIAFNNLRKLSFEFAFVIININLFENFTKNI